ncbi:MAG: choice-of-anchor D domain-containing protein [Candidatus Binataceae bacterium]
MSGCVDVRGRRAVARLIGALAATPPMFAFLAALVVTAGCGGGSGSGPIITSVQPSLSITSPANGATVNTGDTVKITVQATAAAQFTRGVTCIGGRGLGATAIDKQPPFDFSLTIPANLAPGQYNLTALGYGAGTKPLATASVTLQVQSPSALLTLIPPSSELAFSAIGEQLPLRIQGTDSAGKLLDLTESPLLLYRSSDETIAAVSSKGMVTAVGPGNASISVALAGAATAALPIRVMAPALIPSATSIDFGTQPAGTTGTAKPLTITNNVGYPLRILAVNSPLNFPQTNDCLSKSPLPPGGSCVINLSFAPVKAGAVIGIVSIADSAVIARTQVFLTGTGK